MRAVFLSALLAASPTILLAPGCGLRRYLPGKAVIKPTDLKTFANPSPARVSYTGPPRVDMPVIPVQIFGLFYGLDIVLVSKHDDWDMHEYARVDMPSGPLWLAKDARPTGVQTIIADVDNIEGWVPEAAVPRRRGTIQVNDQSSGRDVDISVAYTNWDDQPVDVHVTGRVHRKPPNKRNGSTMGHSRQSTAVALDLQRFGPARHATVSIGGVDVGIERLLGIYPMKFLLEQAQGGVMVASQRQMAHDGGFTLTRPGANPIDPASGQPGWPTHGTEGWTVQAGTEANGTACLVALREGPLITLRYVFVEGGLRRAEAWQINHAQPVTVMRFAPALADLSRPFAGTATSRFTLDINGQQGQGTGTISATWADPEHVDLRLRPEKPWWLADRPMDGRLSYDADGVELEMHRVPVKVDPE